MYNRGYKINLIFNAKDVINNPATYKMDTENFNVAINIKTTDPDLLANFRRYFRVVALFEKNSYTNMALNTYFTDAMEASRCGKEGF